MTAVQWTQEMDAALVDLRVTRKVAWKVVSVCDADGETVSLTHCRKRLKWLQATAGAPGAGPVAKAQEPSDRDGLLWLAKKKRLKHLQVQEGLYYRGLYRRGSTDGGTIRSCLDVRVGGGSGQGGLPLGGDFNDAQSKLELFVVRQIVLHGQVDVLTVMDGVCGLGHSVRFLAGGDQMRAAQLEAVLRVALDQMASNRKVKEAAQQSQRCAA